MAQTLVVVPVHGHWDYALKTVQSLYRTADPVDCVVYDDASPDYSPERERVLLAVDRRVSFVRYAVNAGMTRSWNAGLNLARAGGYKFCCLGNSDLLFTPGWNLPLQHAACTQYALAGPVSNAAGHTSKYQDVALYDPAYKLSDEWPDLDATAARLLATGGPAVPARVNGFCMLTRTAVAWAYAFDKHNVFDPACPMAGNEDRLQDRWQRAGLKFAVVPTSFVFHYRSVTRGPRHVKGRWMRMGQPTPERSEL